MIFLMYKVGFVAGILLKIISGFLSQGLDPDFSQLDPQFCRARRGLARNLRTLSPQSGAICLLHLESSSTKYYIIKLKKDIYFKIRSKYMHLTINFFYLKKNLIIFFSLQAFLFIHTSLILAKWAKFLP